ncbi:MAG: hypothetical protein IT578_12015 [Verrucomicrobiae bacterium]|nr:hypothetical protein [Verrucomicrobiae bacterium]
MRTSTKYAKHGFRWALVCPGLTGSLTKKSSLDDLAGVLREQGYSSLRLDYRRSLHTSDARTVRTMKSMLEGVKTGISLVSSKAKRQPNVIIGRGLGARLTLEALRGLPDVPLVMWTPIMWLRTSLEIRYRLHEIRREGFTVFDNTKVGARFVEALRDPTDAEIKSWIAPKRRHVIVYAEEDKVVPFRLVKEVGELIKAAGGKVEMVAAPGEHPHPDKEVSPQIARIVGIVSTIS